MKEQFATYDIDKKLKELGFDEPCIAYYGGHSKKFFVMPRVNEFEFDTFENTNNNSELSAPLWQQVIDWLRDVHKIDCTPKLHWTSNARGEFYYLESIVDMNVKEGYSSPKQLSNNTENLSFYAAREQAILKALKLIK